MSNTADLGLAPDASLPAEFSVSVGAAASATAAEVLIRSQSLGEEIAEILQSEIIGGRFAPGQRLVERELTARFGVSSIPIREALQELENRGLIVRRHNRGCSVVQLTRKEAARICELRRVLEPKVIEWAAERMTPAQAALLRGQFERLERAADNHDLAGFFQEDVRFHRMIWGAADNAYAARALNNILGSLFASGVIGSAAAAAIDLPEEAGKHRRLLEALCDADAQRSAMALREIAAGFEKHVR
ncbi:MAG: GntR family transcriptional regulator [Candidatus Solibacter sp.]|nr:GntR family transcriptional regulator [Candidatus Solibacter sp.]